MLQSQSVPRFNEDSALKKHWPLVWLGLLCGLFVTSYVLDFNNLGNIFANQNADKAYYSTRYSFPDSARRYSYTDEIQLGGKEGDFYARALAWDAAADKFARSVASNSGYEFDDDEGSRDNPAQDQIGDFARWQMHRRLALELAERQDYKAAEREFNAALNSANALGPRYPAEAISLGDLAVYNEMRAVQMQQVAQILLRAVLPIFSFLAALLPFALFLSFIKSRDKDDTGGRDARTASARLFLKSMLLVSWFGVVVTGWVALRNYGMGLAAGLGDPSAMAFFGTLGALIVSCCLMLRYMPPVKSLSLKRSLVGFGFGGMLVVVKAAAIYLGLCFSLAGHPALKNSLFCESLYVGKGVMAHNLALSAKTTAQQMQDSMAYRKKQLSEEMSEIVLRPPVGLVDDSRAKQLHDSLVHRLDDEVAVPNNNIVPYLRAPTVTAVNPEAAAAPVNLRNLTIGAGVKGLLAYLLLFYPEFLAYILLGLKQTELALSTFNRAVRIKEYFLGSDHWLVIGTLELFGSCLLTFHRTEQLKASGEDYLRQAITRYERSRGRHDELTIAAKMSLAHFYSERGDDKQAEKILLEALRDVGKDMDTLAYCNLLSVIGKLYSRRNNHSRAKQMYKQVIDLLEPRLAKAPSSKGWLGYLRNVYAATPTWQLELKLTQAYLDLAEVFSQAKYHGEAQRLTDDAGKRIGSFESEVVVVLEVAQTYMRARLAQAKILCEHGRYDECFKLLAAAKKQMGRWGYGRTVVAFELVVGECELALVASRGYSNYVELARKSYQEVLFRFGARYGQTTMGVGNELRERWEKLAERFGTRRTGLSAAGVTPPAQGLASDINAFDKKADIQKGVGTLFDENFASTDNWFMLNQENLLTNAGTERAKSLRVKSRATEASEASAAPVSQVIQESIANQDEGIVLRWQRQRKEEVKLESKISR